MRYQLITAKGVAEVASVGGFERQYQVVVDPQKLQAFGIPLDRITRRHPRSNQDVGGRTIELTETEYMIRGRGYLRGLDDLAHGRAQGERLRHAGAAARCGAHPARPR